MGASSSSSSLPTSSSSSSSSTPGVLRAALDEDAVIKRLTSSSPISPSDHLFWTHDFQGRDFTLLEFAGADAQMKFLSALFNDFLQNDNLSGNFLSLTTVLCRIFEDIVEAIEKSKKKSAKNEKKKSGDKKETEEEIENNNKEWEKLFFNRKIQKNIDNFEKECMKRELSQSGISSTQQNPSQSSSAAASSSSSAGSSVDDFRSGSFPTFLQSPSVQTPWQLPPYSASLTYSSLFLSQSYFYNLLFVFRVLYQFLLSKLEYESREKWLNEHFNKNERKLRERLEKRLKYYLEKDKNKKLEDEIHEENIMKKEYFAYFYHTQKDMLNRFFSAFTQMMILLPSSICSEIPYDMQLELQNLFLLLLSTQMYGLLTSQYKNGFQEFLFNNNVNTNANSLTDEMFKEKDDTEILVRKFMRNITEEIMKELKEATAGRKGESWMQWIQKQAGNVLQLPMYGLQYFFPHRFYPYAERNVLNLLVLIHQYEPNPARRAFAILPKSSFPEILQAVAALIPSEHSLLFLYSLLRFQTDFRRYVALNSDPQLLRRIYFALFESLCKFADMKYNRTYLILAILTLMLTDVVPVNSVELENKASFDRMLQLKEAITRTEEEYDAACKRRKEFVNEVMKMKSNPFNVKKIWKEGWSEFYYGDGTNKKYPSIDHLQFILYFCLRMLEQNCNKLSEYEATTEITICLISSLYSLYSASSASQTSLPFYSLPSSLSSQFVSAFVAIANRFFSVCPDVDTTPAALAAAVEAYNDDLKNFTHPHHAMKGSEHQEAQLLTKVLAFFLAFLNNALNSPDAADGNAELVYWLLPHRNVFFKLSQYEQLLPPTETPARFLRFVDSMTKALDGVERNVRPPAKLSSSLKIVVQAEARKEWKKIWKEEEAQVAAMPFQPNIQVELSDEKNDDEQKSVGKKEKDIDEKRIVKKRVPNIFVLASEFYFIPYIWDVIFHIRIISFSPSNIILFTPSDPKKEEEKLRQEQIALMQQYYAAVLREEEGGENAEEEVARAMAAMGIDTGGDAGAEGNAEEEVVLGDEGPETVVQRKPKVEVAINH